MLLIQPIKIILRIFMIYKQRVLADFWSRTDSAICACYCIVPIEWAINSLFMPTALFFDLKSLLKRAVYKT